jgi:hypothetical protein
MKYKAALERYLEWENVTTPMRQFENAALAIPVPSSDAPHAESSAEWMCEFESRGGVLGWPHDLTTLQRYWRGKAMRDWWSKESGWWSKHACVVPEEWVGMLGPLPFIELFGREPITPLVRYWHDNHYSYLDFKMDTWINNRIFDRKLNGYERDYRQHWLTVIFTVILKRKIDGWMWKLRHPVLHRKWSA